MQLYQLPIWLWRDFAPLFEVCRHLFLHRSLKIPPQSGWGMVLTGTLQKKDFLTVKSKDPSPLCLILDMRWLCAVFGFSQTWCFVFWLNVSTLFILPNDIETRSLVVCSNFGHQSCAPIFFLERSGFLLATLSNMPYLPSLFLTLLSWNKTCELRYGVWDVALLSRNHSLGWTFWNVPS